MFFLSQFIQPIPISQTPGMIACIGAKETKITARDQPGFATTCKYIAFRHGRFWAKNPGKGNKILLRLCLSASLR